MKKAAIVLGILALVAGLFLIFHPAKVSAPLTQGPPREWVMLWHLPFGPLGIIIFLVGALLVFGTFPKTARLRALGPFLALCSLGLAAGFYFNDYHDWWWRTFPYSFLLGIAFAFAGGSFIGRSLRELKKCPRWMPLLTIPLFIALAFALFVCIPHSYYSYSDPHSNPYPYFYDYSGDYFYKTLTILAFDILVPLGLFAGFVLGFTLRPKVRLLSA
jgi:uncharacterized membrane protein HdeD (DUF308 family)